MSKKKMGLTGASTKTLKGNLNRHSALTKLYSGKYSYQPEFSLRTKMLQNNAFVKEFGMSDYDKQKLNKELRNVSRYNRINKSAAKYIGKTIPTNPVANISSNVFKTMGTVKSVLKIAPYALAGEIMKPKPAGADSTLYKVKDYKRN